MLNDLEEIARLRIAARTEHTHDFLMIKETSTRDQKSAETPASVAVVLNRVEELTARLPAK